MLNQKELHLLVVLHNLEAILRLCSEDHSIGPDASVVLKLKDLLVSIEKLRMIIK